MNKVLLFCGKEKPENQRYKDEKYMEAAKAVGLEGEFIRPGMPMTSIKEKISRTNGIVLCGGGDIDPEFYAPDEPFHAKNDDIDRERDLIEKESIIDALRIEIPVFGICRGFQIINTTFGGSLYQHIPDQFKPEGDSINHQQADLEIPPDETSHEVKIKKDSFAYSIFKKETISVNSTHHQGAAKIAPGLIVSGRSTDGLPEIIEMPGKKFFFAVQFHPERLYEKSREMRDLFARFAEEIKSR